MTPDMFEQGFVAAELWGFNTAASRPGKDRFCAAERTVRSNYFFTGKMWRLCIRRATNGSKTLAQN